MTKEDIIKLAIEHTISGLKFDEDGLLRFAKLVAEHEREACAKMCDALSIHPEYACDVTKLAALAIRARK
jgi:hypothetical protein